MNKIKKVKEKNNKMQQKCRTEKELDKNKNGKMSKMKRTNQQRNDVEEDIFVQRFCSSFLSYFLSHLKRLFFGGPERKLLLANKIANIFSFQPNTYSYHFLFIFFHHFLSPHFLSQPNALLRIKLRQTILDKVNQVSN